MEAHFEQLLGFGFKHVIYTLVLLCFPGGKTIFFVDHMSVLVCLQLIAGISLWFWWNFLICFAKSRPLSRRGRCRAAYSSWFFLMLHARSCQASVYYWGLFSVPCLVLGVSSHSLVKLLTIRRGHVLEVRALRPALIIKLKKEFTLHSWPPDFCVKEDYSYPDRSY